MDSKNIYQNLCESHRIKSEQWGNGSGLHRHHIKPRHCGGLDEESNYTYLTVRQHIIAHYLLWRIYKNPNDLRAMKMLGAELSFLQRKAIGEYCRDNKIGIFSKEFRDSKEANSIRCKKSALTQRQRKVGTFDPEFRKKMAADGGKVGGKIQKKNEQGIHDPANFKKYASIGGKALKGMICVTNGMHRTRIRPEKLEEYLAMGYVRGFTLSSGIES